MLGVSKRVGGGGGIICSPFSIISLFPYHDLSKNALFKMENSLKCKFKGKTKVSVQVKMQ